MSDFLLERYRKALTLQDRFRDPRSRIGLPQSDIDGLVRVDNYIEAHRDTYERLLEALDDTAVTKTDDKVLNIVCQAYEDAVAEIDDDTLKTQKKPGTWEQIDALQEQGVRGDTLVDDEALGFRRAPWGTELSLVVRVRSKERLIQDSGKNLKALELLMDRKNEWTAEEYESGLNYIIGHSGLELEVEGLITTAKRVSLSPQEREIEDFKFDLFNQIEDASLREELNRDPKDAWYDWDAIYRESGVPELKEYDRKIDAIQARLDRKIDRLDAFPPEGEMTQDEVDAYNLIFEDVSQTLGEYELLVGERNKIVERMQAGEYNLGSIMDSHRTFNHPGKIKEVVDLAVGVARNIYPKSVLDDLSREEREFAKQYTKEHLGVHYWSQDPGTGTELGKGSVAKAIGKILNHFTLRAGNEIANIMSGRGPSTWNWRKHEQQKINLDRRKLRDEIERLNATGEFPELLNRRKEELAKLTEKYESHDRVVEAKQDYALGKLTSGQFEGQMKELSRLTGTDEMNLFYQELEPMLVLSDAFMENRTAAQITRIGGEIGIGLAKLYMTAKTLGAFGLMDPLAGFSAASRTFMALTALEGIPAAASGDIPIGDFLIDMGASYALGEFMTYVNKGMPLKAWEGAKKVAMEHKKPLLTEKQTFIATDLLTNVPYGLGGSTIRGVAQMAKTGEPPTAEEFITNAGTLALFRLTGARKRYKDYVGKVGPELEALKFHRLTEREVFTKSEQLTKDINKVVKGETKELYVTADQLEMAKTHAIKSGKASPAKWEMQEERLYRELGFSTDDALKIVNRKSGFHLVGKTKDITITMKDKKVISSLKKLFGIQPGEETIRDSDMVKIAAQLWKEKAVFRQEEAKPKGKPILQIPDLRPPLTKYGEKLMNEVRAAFDALESGDIAPAEKLLNKYKSNVEGVLKAAGSDRKVIEDTFSRLEQDLDTAKDRLAAAQGQKEEIERRTKTLIDEFEDIFAEESKEKETPKKIPETKKTEGPEGEETPDYFNTTKTGTLHYDDMLKAPQYYKETKGKSVEIEYMTPDEFIERSAAARAKPTTIEEEMRHVDPERVEEYKQRALKGEKMPIPVIDKAEHTQEGRHRAMAAKELGVDKIPVMLVEQVPAEEQYELLIKETEENLKKAEEDWKFWSEQVESDKRLIELHLGREQDAKDKGAIEYNEWKAKLEDEKKSLQDDQRRADTYGQLMAGYKDDLEKLRAKAGELKKDDGVTGEKPYLTTEKVVYDKDIKPVDRIKWAQKKLKDVEERLKDAKAIEVSPAKSQPKWMTDVEKEQKRKKVAELTNERKILRDYIVANLPKFETWGKRDPIKYSKAEIKRLFDGEPPDKYFDLKEKGALGIDIPDNWEIVHTPDMTERAEADWKEHKIRIKDKSDLNDKELIGHEIGHIIAIEAENAGVLLDSYIRAFNVNPIGDMDGIQSRAWMVKNKLHYERFAIDYGNYVAGIPIPSKVKDIFDRISFRDGKYHYETEYKKTQQEIYETEKQYGLEEILEKKDTPQQFIVRDKYGKMTVTVTKSAKSPGKWQLTIYDKNEEPSGDTEFDTYEAAWKRSLEHLSRRKDVYYLPGTAIEHHYELKSRPPGIGTHPEEGLLRIEGSKGRWGTVVYDRMLENEILNRYELEPVDWKVREEKEGGKAVSQGWELNREEIDKKEIFDSEGNRYRVEYDEISAGDEQRGLFTVYYIPNRKRKPRKLIVTNTLEAANKYIRDATKGKLTKKDIPVEKKIEKVMSLDEFKAKELKERIKKGMSDERIQQIKRWVESNAEGEYLRYLKNKIALGFELSEEIYDKYPELRQLNKRPLDFDDEEDTDSIDPRFVSNKELARKGKKFVDGVIYIRNEPVEGPEGETRKLTFAKGLDVDATISLVPFKNVQPAHLHGEVNHQHFLPDAQPKDRSGEDTAIKIEDVKREFRPEEITNTGLQYPYMGPPTINSRGEVIQGNFRSQLLRDIFETEPELRDKYIAYLKQNAAAWGLTAEDIDSVQYPMLVYKLNVDDDMAITLGQQTWETGIESGGQGVFDGKRIVAAMKDDDYRHLLNDIIFRDYDENATLRSIVTGKMDRVTQYLLKKGYLTPSEAAAIFNKAKGTFKPEGIDSVVKIVTSALFTDKTSVTPGGEVKSVPASALKDAELLPKNAINSIYKSAHLLANKKYIDHPSNIRYDVLRAITGYADFKRSGEKHLGAWADQMSFDGAYAGKSPSDVFTPFQMQLIREFTNTTVAGWSKDFTNKIKRYYDLAFGTPEEINELDFAAEEILSKEDAIHRVFGVPPTIQHGGGKTSTLEVPDKEEPADPSVLFERGGKLPRKRPPLNFSTDASNLQELDNLFGGDTKTGKKDTSDKETLEISGIEPDVPDQTVYEQSKSMLNKVFSDGISQSIKARDIYDALVKRYGDNIVPYLKRYVYDLKNGNIELEVQNVDSPTGDMAGDSKKGPAQDRLGTGDVPEGAGGGKGDTEKPGEVTGQGGNTDTGDNKLPGGSTSPAGKRGNKQLYNNDGELRPPKGDTGNMFGERGSDGDGKRIPIDTGEPKDAEGNALKALPGIKQEGDIKFGDLDDIKRTLPQLTEQQHEGVRKAEVRWFGSDNRGKGMLFSWETGVGKTFLGLGIAKRMVLAGNKDILIITPNKQVVHQWVKTAKEWFDLDASAIKNTRDKGKGISVVTYANFKSNDALQSRDFQLVIPDEVHELFSNRQGADTKALESFKKVAKLPLYSIETTKKEVGLSQKYQDIYRETGLNYGEATEKRRIAYNEMIERAKQLSEGTKVCMLSATPFAYHKNLPLGDGLLFEIDERFDDYDMQGVNRKPTPYNKFFIENLGYRIRYGKLTEPVSDVDIDLLERRLHKKLVSEGVMDYQGLEIKYDYSRHFVHVTPEYADRMDEAFRALTSFNSEYELLPSLLRNAKWFNYLKNSQFLESLKAMQSIDRIKKHLELGRKVVVFHNYISYEPYHPFDLRPLLNAKGMLEGGKARQELEDYLSRYEDVVNLPLHNIKNALELYEEVFGDRVVFFNGRIPSQKRAENVARFQSELDNVDIIVVQAQAGGAGLNLQDKTGNHPRVEIQLGLPVRSVTCKQQEGRIYRHDTESNCIYEYLLVGMIFEDYLYSIVISERTGTVENLGKGDWARNLRRIFSQGYLYASPYPVNEGQGSGGKMSDSVVEELTDFEKSKTDYWARQRNSGFFKDSDFYATPEPLGFKMAEWLDIKPGEKTLEPSAGVGSIAAYFTPLARNVVIEPNTQLYGKLMININRESSAIGHNNKFETHSPVNKYNGIAMNPPFGKGGALAAKHLKKAIRDHTKDGSRIIAIVPDGPAFKKNYEKIWQEEDKQKRKKLENIYLVGEVLLPSVTFKKEATSVVTKVMIFDRVDTKRKDDSRFDNRMSELDKYGLKDEKIEGLLEEKVEVEPVLINLRDVPNINKLFDALEKIDSIYERSRPDDDVNVDTHEEEIPGFYSSDGLTPSGKARLMVVKTGKFIPDDIMTQLIDVAKELDGKYVSENRYPYRQGFIFKSDKDRVQFYTKALPIMESYLGVRHEESFEIKQQNKNLEDIKSSSGNIKNKLKGKTGKAADKIKQRAKDNEVFVEARKQQIQFELDPQPTKEKIDLKKAKTKTGRKLVEKILNDPEGRKIGVRSIMEYFAKRLPVEVRIRAEQLRSKAPMKYNIEGNFIRTKTIATLAFSHEVGHAIYELMKDKGVGLAFLEDDYIEIAKLMDSRASGGNPHEGFAELIRMHITGILPRNKHYVLNETLKVIEKEYPKIYSLIEEIKLASQAHQNRSIAAQFRSFNKDLPRWSKPIKERLPHLWEAILFGMARGDPVHQLEQKILKMKKKEMKGTKKAKEIMADLKDFQESHPKIKTAYHNTVRIPAETLSWLGKGGGRILDSEGNYEVITGMGFQDIKDAVGADNWEEFENYAQMKVSLERHEKKLIEYPGLDSGLTPEKLREGVEAIEAEHPEFIDRMGDLKTYYDALIDVAVRSGEFSQKEGDKIKGSWDYYAVLYRYMNEGDMRGVRYASSEASSPRAGIHRLRGGSLRPILNLDKATNILTNNVIKSYYWNKLGQELYDYTYQISTDKKESWEVRKFAGSAITRLELDKKMVTKLSPGEQVKIVADALTRMNEQAMYETAMKEAGVTDRNLLDKKVIKKIENDARVNPAEINIIFGHKPVFRSVKPNAYNVLAIWDAKTKRRNYLQIEDDFLFKVFSNAGSELPDTIKRILSITRPMLMEWKRSVTGSVPFGIRNLVYRNPMSGVMMGKGKASYIPHYYTFRALFGEKIKDEIVGETFSKVLSHSSPIVEKKYLDMIKHEIKMTGISLRGWNEMNELERALAIVCFAFECVIKPVNFFNTITYSSKFASWGEDIHRQGARKQIITAEGSDAEANEAFDVIMGDFGEQSGYRFLNDIFRNIPFGNPAIQTLYRHTSRLTDVMESHSAMYRLAWISVVLPAIIWALTRSCSTEEDRERAAERPVWEKVNYMDIKGVRIPFYPSGYIGVGQSLTWNLLDELVANEPIGERDKFALGVLSKFSALPHPSGFFYPPVRAVLENALNYNFYLERPVVPEWMEDLPVEEQKYADTEQLYVAMGRIMRMSPLKVEHLVRAGISDQYHEVARLIDMASDGRLDREYMSKYRGEIPFVGRMFVRDPIGWLSRSVQVAAREKKSLRSFAVELDDKIDSLIKKKGKDYMETEEFQRVVLAQYEHFENMQRLNAVLGKLNDAIKEEKELGAAADWHKIRFLEREMTRIAANVVYGKDYEVTDEVRRMYEGR